jgi:hypothetical protein
MQDFAPDVTATEDAREAVALQVAPICASETSEVGEASAPICVEFTDKILARHKSQNPQRLVIEEMPELMTSSRDSKHTYAFKLVFHEVCALRNVSKLHVVVHGEQDQSHCQNKPKAGVTPLDFLADVMLCAKRSLSLANYWLLAQHAEENFVFWPQVPARVRKFVAERVGQKLIERGIFRNQDTRRYWRNDFMQRVKPVRQLKAAA